MTSAFETAAGTATGADHVWSGRSNQDARLVSRACRHTLVAVADGCSDGTHSEVGAWMGVHLAVDTIAAHLFSADFHEDPLSEAAWEDIRQGVLRGLEQGVRLMGGAGYLDSERRRLLNDFFLFTLVVGVIGPDHTQFVAIGDGYLAVNGGEVDLGTFEKNMPPYVAYGLTRTSLAPEALRWRTLAEMPTAELQSFVVGTDGVLDLAAAAEKSMPGRPDLVGPMSQFWTCDRYFTNTDMIRRKLVQCNGGVGPRASQAGLLRDDTTLVVGRRKLDT
jgi:hypothetical protein